MKSNDNQEQRRKLTILVKAMISNNFKTWNEKDSLLHSMIKYDAFIFYEASKELCQLLRFNFLSKKQLIDFLLTDCQANVKEINKWNETPLYLAENLRLDNIKREYFVKRLKEKEEEKVRKRKYYNDDADDNYEKRKDDENIFESPKKLKKRDRDSRRGDDDKDVNIHEDRNLSKNYTHRRSYRNF